MFALRSAMPGLAALVLATQVAAQTTSPALSPIALGGYHSCAVDSRGAVFCWGKNLTGQIGNGSVDAERRIAVSGLGDTATALSSGAEHTCTLLASGGVKCWGSNEYGQLGDGTTVLRAAPALVSGLPEGATAIATGRNFSCVVTTSGGVKCWGENEGNLGDGGYIDSPVPVDVADLRGGVRAIAAGRSHACALTFAGGVKCWGKNDSGQIGDGTTITRTRPVEVSGLQRDVAFIAAGADRTCAVTTTQAVMCWGANNFGEVGDGTTTTRLAPMRVAGLVGVKSVALANQTTCALTTAGSVKCWGGDNSAAQGNGYGESSLTPVDVATLTNGISTIAAGANHFCAATVSGEVTCWGANYFGERGIAINSNPFPAVVSQVVGATDTAPGGSHTCALLGTRGITCWGSNQSGQLGSDSAGFHNVAERVAGLGGRAISVAAADDSSCALLASGDVQCWGLTDGGAAARGSPEFVLGLGAGVTSIVAGGLYACAIVANGGVRCWGEGDRLAVEIANLAGIRSIAVNNQFGCAVTASRGVKCWGQNDYGNLGNGTTVGSPSAVEVRGLDRGVDAVAAGYGHACALMSTGRVKCWGGNDNGQLGDGTTTRRLDPVDVAGLAGVRAITAYVSQTCAVTGAGAVWCWGGYGQPLRVVPRPLPEFSDAVEALRFGVEHMCAQLVGGGVNCFGNNRNGQVGDGTRVTDRYVAESAVAADRRSFLDLTPDNGLDPTHLSKFVAVTKGIGASLAVDLQYRAADVGTTSSVYVFALAPSTIVKGTSDFPTALKAKAADGKDTPIQCVLAQLNGAGQMVAVTSANLVAYLTGVLGAQGQSVSILSGTPVVNVGGATFFVGYGSGGSSMINTGINRGVVTIPGTVTCQPQAPQTGWWWNSNESGRGFSIEKRGNNLVFASFLYDVNGRSTWYTASGPVSLDGSFFSGDLYSARGGQTLGGNYSGRPNLSSQGNVTLLFNGAAQGLMVWPGGTVHIERFNIVPNGVSLPLAANLPESGWWWNPLEDGRGFFMEWQGATLDIAGYMYDDAGNPVWYLTVGDMAANGQSFTGNWWSYGNGQTLTGAWLPSARVNDNVAPVTITFYGPDTALMTLPNGRTTSLKRYRF